jgi:hypothetical protein
LLGFYFLTIKIKYYKLNKYYKTWLSLRLWIDRKTCFFRGSQFLVHVCSVCLFSKLNSILVLDVVHIGPKANTNKTQTNRFMWFPKTGYIHGGNKLYIIGGMIQTLNSTQYNPTKPSVSLLHSIFLSNLLFFTLTVALALTAHLLFFLLSLCLYL